ncbi:PssD/Cps14F family polysaccharide biosynthesis glycosyltransferase [Lacticaseibacillus hegangensis]|uniref:PssD/Cps14F family polysaccharide biosynthesis glycosyltransferase n=1 Tax=Lacticaseibacillus hegangensis TaxID=2486010 RepID=A0ABW4CZ14_9LACO|nr:PssD/Cps14F family polysaccharide biosynthesis glycosyltransferase [Lacticaseibacillus hegangensis]
MKVVLVGSSGGHLRHLLMTKPVWKNDQRVWVTFHKEDAISALKGETLYFGYYPTNRNVLNTIRNTWVAFRIILKERPDLIVSSGAAMAVPFFYVGKLFGAKLIYIEVFDRMDKPTLTGRLVYSITDEFIVQWPQMKKVYPKAKCFGGIF